MTLRAFNIKDDMDVMIPLIKAAFHYPENDDWNLNPEELTSIVDSFSLVRRLNPIFQIGGLFNPSLKAIMRGYIWEEDGQAIGLVNLSPLGLSNQTWVIGNVAVLPEHRRKGIAGQLIQAAVALARQNQIKHVILEVIADNLPAVKLYENKGFEIYSKGGQLNRDAALEVTPLPDLPEGYQIEPYHVRDWEARYTLMKKITPPEAQEYEPIHKKKFYKSPPMRLLRSFIMTVAPAKNTSYLVRHQATNAVVARFACYQRRKAGGINEIEIDLDPEHAILAPYLVNRCVYDTLNFSPGRDIELRIAGWQTDVFQSALDAGFVNRAEWYMMGMHLNPAQLQPQS
ncbi:MAG TPA: GNAT family N-acetyltransferase [Phototrophicaceae bacterium]|jgi:ribosomal protein S18 acetylase RimI-like enzyme|nr:GNAT family N-acetyltransferase [Phototrophicaceae bacterium]